MGEDGIISKKISRLRKVILFNNIFSFGAPPFLMDSIPITSA
jgi:hypothetical protein